MTGVHEEQRRDADVADDRHASGDVAEDDGLLPHQVQQAEGRDRDEHPAPVVGQRLQLGQGGVVAIADHLVVVAPGAGVDEERDELQQRVRRTAGLR
jgi:hypothetical protein